MTASAASRPTVASMDDGSLTRGEAIAQLVLCALLLVLWLAVIPPSGGYFGRTWYPATFATLLLVGVTAMSLRRAVPIARAPRVVVGGLVALVVVGWLSIAWSGAQGDAWEAANKLVLLAATAWVVALMPWTARTLALVLGVWSLGVALYLALRFSVWVRADDPRRFLEPASERFSDPLGYPNATAALAAMAAVGALGVSGVRTLPFLVRAAGLPVAVFLAEFAFIPQSRGAMAGVAVAIVVLIALTGDRLRVVTRVVLAAALVVPVVPSLLRVGNAATDELPVAAPLHHAAGRIALTVVIAALAGALVAALERRYEVPARAERALGIAGIVVVLVAGVAGMARYGGTVADLAVSVWTPRAVESEGSRLFSTASEQRPDYARVAVHLFAEHPVAGVGLGNFGREYDARRRHDKHSRYAHNLALRAVSELGAVGLALLLVIVGGLVAGVLGAWRRRAGPERTLIAACAGVAVYFLVHAMFDWIEEFPALVLPAVGLSLATAGLGVTERPGGGRVDTAGSPWAGRLVAAGGAVMVAGLLFVLVPPYLAIRYTDRATGEAGTAPAAAFTDLRRAADLNPLASEPLVAHGVLAESVGRPAEARAAFVAALGREREWFSYLQLALLDAQARRFGQADRELAAARKLSAGDPVIADAAGVIGRRGRVDPVSVNERSRRIPLFTRP